MTISKQTKEDVKEFSLVMLFTVSLLVTSIVFVFFIVRNYININSVLGGNFGGKSIYLYLPKENLERVKYLNITDNYNKNIKYIEMTLKDYKIIKVHNLKNIDTKIPLLLIDNYVLTKDEKFQLKNYVANGGSLIFNFNVDKKFQEDITGLKNVGYIKRDKDTTFFLISNMMSPIKIPNSKRLDIVVYDAMPIFTGKKPLLEWVNWGINDGIYNNKNQVLPNGAVWTGKYKKGSWTYFSFPLYAFSTIPAQNTEYTTLFRNMVDFASKRYKIIKYPYLTSDKMIFISEDTEYKFKDLGHFARVIHSLDVNATAFCVGRLAEKYPDMMEKVGMNPNIEIASHSYSHTDLLKADNEKLHIETTLNKILLQRLSNQTVVGFRPPREQTNKRLRDALIKAGFKYVLEKNIGQLKVRMDKSLMIIPRLGTDDYGYIIELDWDKEKVEKRMFYEMKFITNLGGIYTLSTHTHLLSYGNNIKVLAYVVEEFKKTHIPILKGKDIHSRILEANNIEVKTMRSPDNIVLTIKNNNPKEIKNFTFRAYGNIVSTRSDFVNIKSKIIKKTDDYVDVRIETLPKFGYATLLLQLKKEK